MGGILLGLLLLALPEMYGVGYPALERAIRTEYVVGFLLVLMVGKIVATSLTIAIGGSGGVFAPSLFMGAMLGAAYGDLWKSTVKALPSAVGSPISPGRTPRSCSPSAGTAPHSSPVRIRASSRMTG